MNELIVRFILIWFLVSAFICGARILIVKYRMQQTTARLVSAGFSIKQAEEIAVRLHSRGE